MLPWLKSDDPFPPVETARSEPNGLLCAGWDLSPERILDAYRQGIFPWFSPGEPVLWWSPDPRMVLVPAELKISRSLRQRLKRGGYEIRTDSCFRQVMQACDAPRQGQVDFPQQRAEGRWYPAVPPLCRPSAGLGPADYFGRTLVSNLPSNIKVGVVNISVAGCKIELFQKGSFPTYASTAPIWMTNIINAYGGNPYKHLVDMARLAQKDGVIKGILLHQGESNTNDKEWPRKVKAIYEDLHKDLNLKAEETPLLAGELVNADQQGGCASMNRLITPDTPSPNDE